MSKIFGDLKFLQSKYRSYLQKLSNRRIDSSKIIDLATARAASKFVSQTGLQIAFLINRESKIQHLALGSKKRVYLPDLGRFRLGQWRLRRLRLVVFALKDVAKDIPRDLITDLEKLRLDCLTYISVKDEKIDNIKLASLDTEEIKELDSVDEIDFGYFIDEVELYFRQRTPKSYDIKKDSAVLVGVYNTTTEKAKISMDELIELSKTAGLQIVDSVIQRRKLDHRSVLGAGKLEDLVLNCLDLGADLLVFDHELSPSQLRRITEMTELRILDRSMLILDIFAQRAKSKEGKIQVELAQLKYSLPRLSEKESGLSRLTGGIGGRGPGETKLEVGRRRARDRISELEKKIEKISMQRSIRRERRQSRGVPVISIVGYTNAGKSTLLNMITKGDVLAESKLFATVDPSSRRMRFPNDKEVIFVDTVGFIRDLPKELLAAFKATLEEVREADLLIHLVDVSEDDFRRKIEIVENTLRDLDLRDKQSILVFNKVDLLSKIEVRSLLNKTNALAISAENRIGLAELISTLQKKLLDIKRLRDPGRFTEL